MTSFRVRDTCRLAVLLLFALMVGGGCELENVAEAEAEYPCLEAGPEVGNRALQDDPTYLWTIDDEYAALAREIPGGFGGLFLNVYEGRGMPNRTNIYLLDLSQATAAFEALGGTSATHHAQRHH